MRCSQICVSCSGYSEWRLLTTNTSKPGWLVDGLRGAPGGQPDGPKAPQVEGVGKLLTAFCVAELHVDVNRGAAVQGIMGRQDATRVGKHAQADASAPGGDVPHL